MGMAVQAILDGHADVDCAEHLSMEGMERQERLLVLLAHEEIVADAVLGLGSLLGSTEIALPPPQLAIRAHASHVVHHVEVGEGVGRGR